MQEPEVPFVASSDPNPSVQSDKPPEVTAEEQLKADVIKTFQDRVNERQEAGIKYLSACGLVKIGDQVRKVWMGCPRRNPARDARRQASLVAPLFGWTLNSRGRLSGRQWTKLRKRASRHARAEERKKSEQPQGDKQNG